MRLLTLFPKRGGYDPTILSVTHPKSHYPAIRKAAAILLRDGHVNDVLAATYDRLIVDEYQDCSEIQHAIVYYAALSLRTCVLGDPMQAIFGFQGNALADWQQLASCAISAARDGNPFETADGAECQWAHGHTTSCGAAWLPTARSRASTLAARSPP